MIRITTLLSLICALAACGGEDKSSGVDSGATGGDACTLYCDNALANCTGANELYADRASCEAACAAMPEGNADDQAGNTAYCRAYHAGAPAEGDPAAHCPHASAASDGDVCGSTCEAYCDQIQTNCTGANKSFDDDASCLAACAAFPSGAFNDTSGNTAQCRTYHASFPAAGDAAAHCPHASPSSDSDVCGTACDAYCDQAMTNCTGGNELYANRAACDAACAGFTDGAFNDQAGDTTQCRVYHASFPAAADAALHCPHASDTPTAPCM